MQIRIPMYKHPVYFESVNSLTVARYAAAMNIDFIGFCFEHDDSRYITVAKAKEIISWLSGVKFFGEFRGKPADEIVAIGLELNLDAVVLRGDYSRMQLDAIPFTRITTDDSGDMKIKEDRIIDKDGKIFALCFETGPEDDTGIIDFSEVTEALEKLETK
jgi:phosphoribosylanthranilate isomerase